MTHQKLKVFMSFLLIFVFIAAAAASAATALSWAIKNGQFKNLSAGAATIFDDEATDAEFQDAFPKDTTGE